MTKQIILSIQQREKALIDLIQDGETMKFNKDLLEMYKTQLKEIQEEIKRDREALLNFNRIERGLN